MLRVCAASAGFIGQGESEWNNGAILKFVSPTEITVRNTSQLTPHLARTPLPTSLLGPNASSTSVMPRGSRATVMGNPG